MTAPLEPVKLAARLRVLADTLEQRGTEAMRRAADHRTTLRSAVGGRGAKGDHSDPTATTAANLDPSAAWWDDLNQYGATLDVATLGIMSLLATVLSGEQQGRTAATVWCANVHGCPNDAPAEPGRAGRCQSCWRYRRDHGRDRKARYDRTPDKVHVHPVTGDVLDPVE